MQKIQRQLGQYVVLSLPRDSGGGFFSGGLKLGDALFKKLIAAALGFLDLVFGEVVHDIHQAILKLGREIFRAGEHPSQPLNLILRYAAAGQVTEAEAETALGMKLLGRLAVPACRDSIVGQVRFLAVMIVTEVALRARFALRGSFPAPLPCFLFIFLHAFAILIADTECVFGVGIALKGRLHEPRT